jgi:hypothetical protein
LDRIRAVRLVADDGTVRTVTTKPSATQATILRGFDVDTATWRSRLTG